MSAPEKGPAPLNQRQFKLQHDPGLGGQWERTDHDYPGHMEWKDIPPEAGSHRITASTGNNKALGDLSWNNGVIQSVNVNENWQHKGMATQMYNRAKEITPGLRHSDNRTEAGEGWAKSIGGTIPERVQDHPEWAG